MNHTLAKQTNFNLDVCWGIMFTLAIGIVASLLPDMASAAGTTDQGNAIQVVMCNIVSVLNGTTGKAIATVAVIAVGVGALLGKISWGMALIVALGIALIFGAASIVTALGGDSTACTSGTVQLLS